jgi:hypothetical protein
MCDILYDNNIYILHKRGEAHCIMGSSLSAGQVERASGFLWGNVVEESA